MLVAPPSKSSTEHSKRNMVQFVFVLDMSPESEYHYIRDHAVDGRVLFPGTGYLHLVWRVLAKMQNTVPAKTAIELWDVNLHQATIIPATGKTNRNNDLTPGRVGGGGVVVTRTQMCYPPASTNL